MAKEDQDEAPLLPRIHLWTKYRHNYSVQQLMQMIVSAMNGVSKLYEEHKFPGTNEDNYNIFSVFENDLVITDEKIIDKEMRRLAKFALSKIKYLYILYYVLIKNIGHMDTGEIDYEEWIKIFHWDSEFINKSIDDVSEDLNFIKPDILKNIMNGEIIAWPSAVWLSLRWVINISEKINDFITTLTDKNKRDQYKCLLSLLVKLGFWWDFVYSSSLADANDIFYSNNQEDIDLLESRVNVIKPYDLQKHLIKLQKVSKDIELFMGVVQKGFQHESFLKNGLSMMYHSTLYTFKRSSGFHNGEYFIHTLDKSTLSRMVKAPENIFLK